MIIPVTLVPMFNRLLGRKQQPNPEPGPQFAMLMLRSGKGLKEQNIAAAWKALFPNLPALKPTEVEKDDKGAVASFSTDGRTLLLAVIGVPIPPPEVAEAAARSWMWQQKKSAIDEQRAHAI